MDYYIDNQDRLIPFSGPGHFHDPDTLLLGNFGLSFDQSKVQLAVWAMLAAPLLISTDLRTIEPEIKELLLNRDIIAIDQDPLGIMGRVVNPNVDRVRRTNVWIRQVTPIIEGKYSFAVAYVNRGTYGVPQPFQSTLSFLTLDNAKGYQVKDLFDPQRTFEFLQGQTVEEMINPMGVNFYKFTPKV
jgi:Alpha galactosidase A/Alpha galactosidase A C-terminal beta sandwich domain